MQSNGIVDLIFGFYWFRYVVQYVSYRLIIRKISFLNILANSKFIKRWVHLGFVSSGSTYLYGSMLFGTFIIRNTAEHHTGLGIYLNVNTTMLRYHINRTIIYDIAGQNFSRGYHIKVYKYVCTFLLRLEICFQSKYLRVLPGKLGSIGIWYLGFRRLWSILTCAC